MLSKRLLPAVFAALMIVAILLTVSDKDVKADPYGIEVDETTFPDANFRHYVEYYLDNGDGILFDAEIAGIVDIDLKNLNIGNLEGIQYFTELKKLDCSHNSLTLLNLDHNTKLEWLNCSYNSLKTIWITHCPELKHLDYSVNQMRTINVYHNTKLEYLSCVSNQMEAFNLSQNTALTNLYCHGNKLKKLDLTHNTKLTELFCYANYLTELDLSKNKLLLDAYVGDNELTEIDVSNNPELAYFSFEGNHISEIDVTHNPSLVILTASDNPLSVINVSKNPYLSDLRCSGTNVTSLDLSHNPDISYLECSEAKLTKLDVTGLVHLNHLICNDNQLSSLDVSKCPELNDLQCQNNNIKTLHINNNPDLINVYQNCSKTPISSTASVYSDGGWPIYDYWTSALAIDDSTQVYLTKPTSTPTPKPATPTPKPATPTPTKKPATPTPKPSSGGSSSSSAEGGVEGFVERLYSVALDRASDPNGKADWVSQIRSGELSGADAARGFFLSPEFINSGLSDADFLTRLYRTFFDREPDRYGFNNWMAELEKGASRESILAGFINSTEWANLCLKFGINSGGTGVPNITIEPSEAVIGFATRLYTTCLCREFDPGGLTDWSTQLANRRISGSEAAHGFFFSREFLDGNYSDEEYVTRLYHTFMDREPDPAGFADWTGQLAAGASRESVFRGFAGSVEWAGICADYGILK